MASFRVIFAFGTTLPAWSDTAPVRVAKMPCARTGYPLTRSEPRKTADHTCLCNIASASQEKFNCRSRAGEVLYENGTDM